MLGEHRVGAGFLFFGVFFLCVCVDLETQSTRRSAMPVVVPPPL